MTNAPTTNPPTLALPNIYPTRAWIMSQEPLMAMTDKQLRKVADVADIITLFRQNDKPQGLAELLAAQTTPDRPGRLAAVSLTGIKLVLDDAEMLGRLMAIAPDEMTEQSIESTREFLGMLQINPWLTVDVVMAQGELTGMKYPELMAVWTMVSMIGKTIVGRYKTTATQIRSYGQVHTYDDQPNKGALITMDVLRGVLGDSIMMKVLAKLHPAVMQADTIALARQFCKAIDG